MKFKFYLRFILLLSFCPIFSYGQEVVPESTAEMHKLFLLRNGTIMGCGPNTYGELGIAPGGPQKVAIPIKGLTDIISVKEGHGWSMALKKDGTVWTWGENYFGALGDGTRDSRHIPEPISGLSCVVQIETGEHVGIALLSDGTVKTWGDNRSYALGHGTIGSIVTRPTPVPGLSNVKKVVAGGGSSVFAILTNGDVVVWGRNEQGQLGIGSITSLPNGETPTQNPYLQNVLDISTGGLHAIALLSDHTIRTWGHGFNGALGNTTNTNKLTPVTPSVIQNNVSKIWATYTSSYALLTDGSLYAWGKNERGELTLPTVVSYFSPQPIVPGLTGIADLQGTYYTFSILLNDGSMKMYGWNEGGQLGDNSINSNVNYLGSIPVGVPPLKANSPLPINMVAYAGEDISVCGAAANMQLGTVYCNLQGASFSWMPRLGLSSDNISNPVLDPNIISEGQHVYTVTMVYNGVTTTDQVTVTKLADITFVNTGNSEPQTVCNNTPTTIASLKNPVGGDGVYYYQWKALGAAPISALSSTTVANPIFTYAVEGDYQYEVTVRSALGCENMYTRTIHVQPSVTPRATFNYLALDGLCDYNNTGASFVASYENPSPFTYTWDFGGGLIMNGGIVNPNLSAGGVYNVKLTVTDACSNSASITKRVELYPSSGFYNPDCCTNLYSNYTSGFYGDHTISSNISWTTPKTIKGTLYIEKGYTLKIIGTTVRFGMNGRIVVKPGGRLEITNSTVGGLDNGTCKTMWQGIEVWGNKNYSQGGLGASEQGKLTVNGTTSQIIDAHKAVFVGQRNLSYVPSESEAPPVDYVDGFGGGIINVQGCAFNRNGIDIQFAPYTDPNMVANPCVILNNKFNGGTLLDPAYNTTNTAGLPMYPSFSNKYYAPSNNLGRTPKHVKLYRVSNLNFQDNTFDNAEYGIDATDAKFNVKKSATGTGNDFKNLKYGIAIGHTTAGITFPHTISGNKFNKIGRTAISISGGGGDSLLRNSFGESLIPPLSTQADNPRGIYLNSTSGFNVIDNTFYRLDTAIQVSNSGASGGKITSDPDGNTFINCRQGVLTSGNNSNMQIHCANFTYVNEQAGEYANKNWNIAGLLGPQGENSTDHMKLAGNEFLQTSRKDIRSSVEFKYYRHSQSATGTASVVPTIALGSAGWDVFDIVNKGVAKQSSSCASTPPCAPNCTDLIAENTVMRTGIETEYDAMLTGMEDNTSPLLSDLQDPALGSEELKNNLVASSPLSDLVMASLLENYYKFTQHHFVEIMERNLPVSAGLWEMMQDILPEFTPAYQSYIVNRQSYNENYTTLTSLEREYEKISNDRQFLLEGMVYEEAGNPEEAAQKLLAEDNENKQTAIGTLLANGDYEGALTNLPLVNIENTEDAEWIRFTRLHIELMQNKKTWFDMNKEQELTVRNIAVSISTKAAAQAWAVLHLVYGEEIPVAEQIHTPSAARKIKRSVKQVTVTENRLMEAYPNPASDFVNIPYYAKEEQMMLEVVDLLGKVIRTVKLDKGYQLLQMNVSAVGAGTYIVKMKDKNANTQSVAKIIVQ